MPGRKHSTHSTEDVRSMFQCLESTPAPHQPRSLTRQHVYANIPEDIPTVSSSKPKAYYQSQTLGKCSGSPGARKNNFLYASRRSVPGRSPFVNSVKVAGLNNSSINRLGLPHQLKQTPWEENGRQPYTRKLKPDKGEDICVI